ncbi:MAG: alpha/beta fold hydrolase [Acidimicrobiia bacterium]|nr:alpha/beta fold hydrolase [Acidimicrobiia bacterium]
MGIPRQVTTIHGHEVSYRLADEDRSRPTLLLIHGMAGSSRTWRHVMPDLAEDHTVLAPDLLGHGESAKPVGDYSLGAYASGLRDLLATLDLGTVTVVGSSFGGGVAMQLAYQHPELVDRLVLVGSGGLGREVSWLLRALTLPGAEYLMPVLFPPFFRDRGDTVSKALHDRGWHAPHLAEMWRAYASLTQAENRAAFVRTLRAVLDPGGQTVNATDRLYLAAAMPTMLVWGDEDPIIPVEHAYTAHKAIPGSRLEIFEGGGHFPHLEDPERFVAVVRDFVATTEPVPNGLVPFRDLLIGA